MFNRRQVVTVAACVSAASIAAMMLIAAAAWLGMSGDALTAMSTVISTALAAVAVVASLGAGNSTEHEAPRIDVRIDGDPGLANSSSSASISKSGGRLEVDVQSGEVRFLHGDVRIVLMLAADRITVRSNSSPGH